GASSSRGFDLRFLAPTSVPLDSLERRRIKLVVHKVFPQPLKSCPHTNPVRTILVLLPGALRCWLSSSPTSFSPRPRCESRCWLRGLRRRSLPAGAFLSHRGLQCRARMRRGRGSETLPNVPAKPSLPAPAAGGCDDQAPAFAKPSPRHIA